MAVALKGAIDVTSDLRILVLLLAVVTAGASDAGTCAVPGSHPSVAAAVAAPSCSLIQVAPGTYPEQSIEIARSLTLEGSSSADTTLEGALRIRGSGTVVELRRLTIDATVPSVAGCVPRAVDVDEGARVTVADLVGRAAGAGPGPAAFCRLFADDFESGDTSAWSPTAPG